MYYYRSYKADTNFYLWKFETIEQDCKCLYVLFESPWKVDFHGKIIPYNLSSTASIQSRYKFLCVKIWNDQTRLPMFLYSPRITSRSWLSRWNWLRTNYRVPLLRRIAILHVVFASEWKKNEDPISRQLQEKGTVTG